MHKYKTATYIKINYSLYLHMRFQAIVHHPLQWPDSAYFIPTGTKTTIVIKPAYSYATPEVNRLPLEDRECLFPV